MVYIHTYHYPAMIRCTGAAADRISGWLLATRKMAGCLLAPLLAFVLLLLPFCAPQPVTLEVSQMQSTCTGRRELAHDVWRNGAVGGGFCRVPRWTKFQSSVQ